MEELGKQMVELEEKMDHELGILKQDVGGTKQVLGEVKQLLVTLVRQWTVETTTKPMCIEVVSGLTIFFKKKIK